MMNAQEMEEQTEILRLVTKELLKQTAEYCENMQKFFKAYPELKCVITAAFELRCLENTVAQMVLGNKPKLRKIITNLQEEIEK